MSNIKTNVGTLRHALKMTLAAAAGVAAVIKISKDVVVEVATHSSYAKSSFAAEGSTEHAIASVPAQVVNSVLGTFAADDEVTLSPKKGGGIQLKVGATARFMLKPPEADPASMFEVKQEERPVKIFVAKGADLKSAIRAAAYIAPKSDVRYYLCGVNLAVAADYLVVTGTDGFSLQQSVSSIHASTGSPMDSRGVILPKHAAHAVETVFGDHDEVTVTMTGKGLITFSTDGFTWSSTLVQGAFPAVEVLLEAEKQAKKASLTANTKGLLAALERVRAISGDLYCRLSADTSKNSNLVVASVDEEQRCTVLVEGQGSLEMGITNEILIDLLKTVPTQLVWLARGDDDKKDKLYVRPIDEEGNPMNNWVAMMMPAQV